MHDWTSIRYWLTDLKAVRALLISKGKLGYARDIHEIIREVERCIVKHLMDGTIYFR